MIRWNGAPNSHRSTNRRSRRVRHTLEELEVRVVLDGDTSFDASLNQTALFSGATNDPTFGDPNNIGSTLTPDYSQFSDNSSSLTGDQLATQFGQDFNSNMFTPGASQALSDIGSGFAAAGTYFADHSTEFTQLATDGITLLQAGFLAPEGLADPSAAAEAIAGIITNPVTQDGIAAYMSFANSTVDYLSTQGAAALDTFGLNINTFGLNTYTPNVTTTAPNTSSPDSGGFTNDTSSYPNLGIDYSLPGVDGTDTTLPIDPTDTGGSSGFDNTPMTFNDNNSGPSFDTRVSSFDTSGSGSFSFDDNAPKTFS